MSGGSSDRTCRMTVRPPDCALGHNSLQGSGINLRKRGSKILKPPPARNCFTLAMTNKLVVIINILKVPKIKEPLLYEIKFLVPNYSCLQNPWIGGRGLPPPDPRSLCPLFSTEFVEPPPPLPEQNSWVRHCRSGRVRKISSPNWIRSPDRPARSVLFGVGIEIFNITYLTFRRLMSTTVDVPHR
jgi:hypothetical protein